MIIANDCTYRVLADGLIHQAEQLPRKHPAVQCLRDAAASLLDADMHLSAANANDTQPKESAA